MGARGYSGVSLDRLGQPIHEGDYIIYGHALGTSAGLQLGLILEIRTVQEDSYSSKSGDPRFVVVGVDQDWKKEKPKLCSRKGTLLFPERILVVQRGQVSTDCLDLLDEYQEKYLNE